MPVANDRRVVIFGNSGSGKSTLAHHLAEAEGLEHLDLDTLAWSLTDMPPERKPLGESQAEMQAFLDNHSAWVIEGCYADLLDYVLPASTDIIYMNLPVEACVANAKARPWEPHKYASQEAQNANLDMLINWIRQYDDRDDVFSRKAHERLFETYEGDKTVYTSNRR